MILIIVTTIPTIPIVASNIISFAFHFIFHWYHLQRYWKVSECTLAKGEPLTLLIWARNTAARFDEAPNYSIGAIPFLSGIKNEKMDDILGKTAAESLENCCKEINDHEFDELWKKITDRHKLII